MVYIDCVNLKYKNMVMNHLFADSLEELHLFVDKLGINRKYFQKNASFPHYDICLSKKELALKNGAIELKTRRETADKLKELKQKEEYIIFFKNRS